VCCFFVADAVKAESLMLSPTRPMRWPQTLGDSFHDWAHATMMHGGGLLAWKQEVGMVLRGGHLIITLEMIFSRCYKNDLHFSHSCNQYFCLYHLTTFVCFHC
jgi:hypothetical protein